jgi:anti-sigma B factor antagonist
MSLSCPGPCLEPNHLVRRTATHVIRYSELWGPEFDGIREDLLRTARRRGASTLVLDFGGVAFLTAEVLGKLVALHRRLRGKGRELLLTNISAPLFEIFAVTKLDRLLDVRRADGRPRLAGSVRA